MDIKARSADRPRPRRRATPAASRPTPVASAATSPRTSPASAPPPTSSPPLGADAFGESLLTHTRDAGVHVDHVVVGPQPTGTYLAVLDHEGDLSVAVSDMTATDALTVADLDGVRAPRPALRAARRRRQHPGRRHDLARSSRRAAGDVPVVLEPVRSSRPAGWRRSCAPDRPVLAITPNIDELAALVGHDVAELGPGMSRAAAELHDLGVQHVWVRRGAAGQPAQQPHAPTAPPPSAPTDGLHRRRRRDRRRRLDDRRLRPRPPGRSRRTRRRGIRAGHRRPHDRVRLTPSAPTSPTRSSPGASPSKEPHDAPRRPPPRPRPRPRGRRGPRRRPPGRRARVDDHQPRHALPRATSRWPARSSRSSATAARPPRRSPSSTVSRASASPPTSSSCSPRTRTSPR